jgi:hypothetical protein
MPRIDPTTLAEVKAKAHAALDFIFESGSHGPEVVAFIADTQRLMEERPGSKVRGFTGLFLLDSRAENGRKIYATHGGFVGNDISIAACVQFLSNAHAQHFDKSSPMDLLEKLIKNGTAIPVPAGIFEEGPTEGCECDACTAMRAEAEEKQDKAVEETVGAMEQQFDQTPAPEAGTDAPPAE